MNIAEVFQALKEGKIIKADDPINGATARFKLDDNVLMAYAYILDRWFVCGYKVNDLLQHVNFREHAE